MKRHIIQPLSLALLLTTTAALADYRDDIGYKTLEDQHRLISQGANVNVGQVEALVDQAYMPDRSSSEFSGKHFWPPGSFNPSGHATMVGEMFYGHDGIAPNTPNIRVFDSTGFLTGSNGLRVGKKGSPTPLQVSVLNNSWVAAFTTDAANVEAVRRLDWMINRDDVLVVSSVGNGAGSDYPKLLATSYNGMAVGILGFSGSSDGPINFDARGPRTKPDLVVPVTTTSAAAGLVSGAAALIRSEAKARRMNVSELTTKAILMAGAQRPDDWQRGAAGTQDDETVPLDYRYGAGGLRVDNSFDILVAGQHSTGGVMSGWDSGIAHKKNHVYPFRVTDAADDQGDDDSDSFTAVLTWNRDVKRSQRGAYSTNLADLEMSLLVKNGTRWNRVSRSDSNYDNVETITLSDLAPGAYRLTVRGDRATPYSLAWFTSENEDHHGGGENSGPGGGEMQTSSMMSGEVSPTPVPEPTMLGLLISAAFLASRPNKKPR